MIHSFTFDGVNILLDVNSGSLHVVDDMALKAIELKEKGWPLMDIEGELKKEYAQGVGAFMGEFAALIKAGLLFAEEAKSQQAYGGHVVKALCLHVAHDCNLMCRYCFAGQGKFSGDSSLMKVETGQGALDFLLESSGERRNVEVDFFGGEPLLNFSVIKEIVAYGEREAKKRGKKVNFTLTTNGILLKGDIARYFQEKNFNVVLSLDGRKEINDFMRPFAGGRGSFASIYPNIIKFVTEREHRGYFVRGTYTRHNLDFVKDVAYLTDLGLKSISLEPVVGGKEEDYCLRLEDAEVLLTEYDKLTRLYLEKRAAGEPFSFFHFNIDLSGGPCFTKRTKGCGAGTEYLAVTPEGELYPCHQLVGEEKFRLGSLAEGFNPSLTQPFAEANVFTKEKCISCWAKYYCGGGCLANAYKQNGDILENDQLGCLLEKKRLECALYIKAVEELQEGSNKTA